MVVYVVIFSPFPIPLDQVRSIVLNWLLVPNISTPYHNPGDIELQSFVEYFQKQWIKPKFCNWQLFNTPVGFAMTNSPIESYNNTVKESFTKRVKHHLKTAVEVFQDVVNYESNHGKEFKSEVRVRKYMRIQAKTIILKKQLIATNTENEFLYKHFNEKLGFARINLVSKSCTCHKYFVW